MYSLGVKSISNGDALSLVKRALSNAACLGDAVASGQLVQPHLPFQPHQSPPVAAMLMKLHAPSLQTTQLGTWLKPTKKLRQTNWEIDSRAKEAELAVPVCDFNEPSHLLLIGHVSLDHATPLELRQTQRGPLERFSLEML